MASTLAPYAGHVARVAFAGSLCLAATASAVGFATGELPAKLGDREFWGLHTELSEAGGYFRSDNFVSNETTFQYIIPELTRTRPPGGVYMGVGPDQNFTYIAALRPRIAFIVDIRRQNSLQHLMYKALFEMSPDRAEFLSRLFSRPRPAGVDSASSVDALFAAYDLISPDTALYVRTLGEIRHRLVRQHGFPLSDDDLRAIEYVFDHFYQFGPDLTYSSSTGSYGRQRGLPDVRRMPTYAELMVATDAQGVKRGYLANERSYRALRRMQLDNLIVPLVGDFAGPKAVRAVGQYLRRNGATVTAFYLSNVEQYLFRQGDDWSRFFDNVSTLPVDSSSTFIRAVFNTGFGGAYLFRPTWPPTPAPQPMDPSNPTGVVLPRAYMRSVTMLAPIGEQTAAVKEGRVQTYFDVVQTSRVPEPAGSGSPP